MQVARKLFGVVWQRRLITDCNHHDKSDSGKERTHLSILSSVSFTISGTTVTSPQPFTSGCRCSHTLFELPVQSHLQIPMIHAIRHRDAIPAMSKAQNTCQSLAQRLAELPLDIYAA